MISDSANLRSEFILHLILDEDIAKATNRVAVGHLIAACDLTKLREGPAINHLGSYSHIGYIVDHLQDIDPQHQLQVVGLVAVLSFVIARLDQFDPFAPRNQLVHLLKEFFLVCLHFR